jgi:polysaccharide biosynthesis/export protein
LRAENSRKKAGTKSMLGLGAIMSTEQEISAVRYIAKRFTTLSRSLRIFFLGLLLVSQVPTWANAQTTQMQTTAGLQGSALGSPSPSRGDVSQANASVSQAGSYIVLPAESLGSSDLIEIVVPYCPELSRNFRIGTDGFLILPLLHHEIQVAGLTPGQVAARIRQALIGEQVMPDPIVSVSVLEYRSRPVSVVGAVVHPLTFQATGEITLLDAIAMAGGFVPAGAADVLVSYRHITAEGTIEITVQTIPVRGLLLQANPASNILLHGGEEIRVTETGKVFIAGNVVRPGMYPMQGNEDTTVLKALALSEGLQQYSAQVAYIYRLRAVGAEREEIEVPLSKIIARKNPDVGLKADDILYIPANNGKRMTARVLNQLAGFGQTAAAGILIYK